MAVLFSASKNVLLLQLQCSSFMMRGANLTFLSAYPEQARSLHMHVRGLCVRACARVCVRECVCV